MRIPFIYRSDNTADLTSAQRNARALVGLGARTVGIFMLVMFLLWALVTYLLNGGLTSPTSATGVLKDAKQLQWYSWSSESVRHVTLGQQPMRQDAFRTAAVDLSKNHWEATTVGVWSTKTSYVSDGHLTLSLTPQNQTWQMVTNYCGKEPAIPASAVTMPSAQELLHARPYMISSQGTDFGNRAWVLGFHPTPQILSQLFWLQATNDMTRTDPGQRDWVLSASERKALAAGQYKVDWAYAWVIRSSMLLRQIEVRIQFTNPGGSNWNFLAKMFPQPHEELKSTSLSPPSCSADTVGSTTSQTSTTSTTNSTASAPAYNSPTSSTTKTSTKSPSKSASTGTQRKTKGGSAGSSTRSTLPSRKRGK